MVQYAVEKAKESHSLVALQITQEAAYRFYLEFQQLDYKSRRILFFIICSVFKTTLSG